VAAFPSPELFVSPMYSDADMINFVCYWNEGASSSVSDVDSCVIISNWTLFSTSGIRTPIDNANIFAKDFSSVRLVYHTRS
jgi:hypothetical protein